jgi:hypothetical protein
MSVAVTVLDLYAFKAFQGQFYIIIMMIIIKGAEEDIWAKEG